MFWICNKNSAYNEPVFQLLLSAYRFFLFLKLTASKGLGGTDEAERGKSQN